MPDSPTSLSATTAALRQIRSAAIDGRAHNPVFRKTQLGHLHAALVAHGDALQKVMAEDGLPQGVRAAEVQAEYCLALQCVADHYAAIDPVRALHDEYALARSQDSPGNRVPVGIVVIEADTTTAHTFVLSVVSALAPALAAGNCVVVQAQQTLLQTPRLLLQVLQGALDSDIFYATTSATVLTDDVVSYHHVRVLQNGASSSPSPANHIVSNADARVVAIVERDADVQAAATALVRARFSLGGHSPYAPDVVLVSEWCKKEFLFAATQAAARFMAEGGQDAGVDAKPPKQRGIPKNATRSLSDRVGDDPSIRVISLGSNGLVVSIEERSSFLLQQKTRAPCLAVVAVTSTDDAIDLSKSFGSLSAAFVFTKSPPVAKYLGQFVDADMVVVNQFPASLLFGPVAPAGSPPSPPWTERYSTDLFSVPKPQFVTQTKSTLLDNILAGGTRHLKELEKKATVALTPQKRPLKAVQLGFFEQGIVTGGVLLLSSVVTCTGVLCYYAVKHARVYL
ncbi:hypothetical protein SEUCBS139899_010025 [Sporothrix eucalyptigena]|uniref:Aldehyde dehydrogenase domain-containing protein n=1 Tax=Sporothrix eucalyptigena TaxID=1812306 RepID=A0ABP0ATH2_9PEZI